MVKKKSRARIAYEPTKEPNKIPCKKGVRTAWLKEASKGFVSPSPSNKKYYAVILETLWPKGHGIPGPLVSSQAIREAVDNSRGSRYLDVFRRVRELQGEEGFLGIVKSGNNYQLVDLGISQKRIPRSHLNKKSWADVLSAYGMKCAACGRSASEKGFQQDHKVPRLRGGGDNIENWQPLCDECNNFKSTACRDCHQDCAICCWAYPERYKPIFISGKMVERVRRFAADKGKTAESILESLIKKSIPRVPQKK